MMRPLQTGLPRAGHRPSFTLIEVVASLVLLGTTVVALLSAQTRALQQLRASNWQRQAAHLAEELIAGWALEDHHPATDVEGVFPDHPGWSWRRSVGSLFTGEPAGLIRIQLEVIRTDDLGQSQTMASFVWLEAGHDPAP